METHNPLEDSGLIPLPKRGSGQGNAAASPRGQALAMWSFPADATERGLLDAISQTPDEKGNVLCWRRLRRCSNLECRDPETLAPHKFKKSEYALWNCPVCGKDRHCRRLVTTPNRGCHQHGGATPGGWELPQTKNGEYSKHLRLDSMRSDYERMLLSQKLYEINDAIALLKVMQNEIVAEYGGGASRELLKRMKQNRDEYKRQMHQKEPDPTLLREFDRDLDKMIAEGARSYEVREEFMTAATKVAQLIESRDRHVQKEGMMITNDKAWVLLDRIEQTFRVGAEFIVDAVDENFVRLQCETLGVDFSALSSERVKELMQTYRDQRQQEKRKMLGYASKQFTELGKAGIDSGSRHRP